MKPDTVVGWQRKAFHLFSSTKRVGRAQVSRGLPQLIGRMAREDGWLRQLLALDPRGPVRQDGFPNA